MNHVQSSCRTCPSGFFCPDGSSQPSECPSGRQAGEGAADASQCAAVSALPLGALAAIIASVVVVDLFHACVFIRGRIRNVADSKAWIIAALILGPFVWLMWWCMHPDTDQPLLSLSLLSHRSPSSDSIDSSHNYIAQVASRDIRINKHVKPKCGGGGTVYQATWNGKLYAIKKPRFIGAMTDCDEAKFVKELENQARLRHPNCVRVYGVCLEKDDVFIIMEWMHGGSLWERLLHTRKESLVDQQGRAASGSSGLFLSARKRLTIARDVCDGLQYMHSKGMVHGDIKSLNILLDKEGNAKLCDFGLTTVGLAISTVNTSSSGGTAAWSAPEILCQGQRHTPQTDMYALGVLMWELLTCAQPFEGLNNHQIMGQLNTSQRPPIPHPLPSGIPVAYVAMMTRCWDQDPANRPSAAAVHRCMIELDPSTQANEPVELFPRGYRWTLVAGPGQSPMLLCLTRALPEACCAPVLRAIAVEAEKSILIPSVQHMIAAHNIAALEAQSIFVYTASQGFAVCPSHGAPFVSYNTALRDAKPGSVGAWSDYSFLLYNALLKLPSVACTVYRGLNIPLSDMSHLYWKGGFVWLRSPTSTTTDKEKTMRQFGQGVGAGAGTFMELRVKNAKEIETFSAVPAERERLIAPNTCFRVLQAWSAADVRLLEGFGKLPPNVDIVVLEEVLAALVGV